jgi:hypothetical protein
LLKKGLYYKIYYENGKIHYKDNPYYIDGYYNPEEIDKIFCKCGTLWEIIKITIIAKNKIGNELPITLVVQS